MHWITREKGAEIGSGEREINELASQRQNRLRLLILIGVSMADWLASADAQPSCGAGKRLKPVHPARQFIGNNCL